MYLLLLFASQYQSARLAIGPSWQQQTPQAIYGGFLRGPSASEHRHTSVPAPARGLTSSRIGFSHRRGILRPLFRTLHGPLGHQRSSACFRLVCLSSTYLSFFCRSDWLANPIARTSFSRLAQSPSIDSLDSESSTTRSFKPILWADIGILTTRVLRARKTRKCSNASDVTANRKCPSLDIEIKSWRIPVSLSYQALISRIVLQCNCPGRYRDPQKYIP
jgi:hypothetical protein